MKASRNPISSDLLDWIGDAYGQTIVARRFGGSLSRDPLYRTGWDVVSAGWAGRRLRTGLSPQGPPAKRRAATADGGDRAPPLTIALGPAGTGKTYLAVSAAVAALEAGEVGRIVLTRPAVEAGERLGYLPGDIGEKLAPYLRPLNDALNERLGGRRVKQLMTEGAIEIAPIG